VGQQQQIRVWAEQSKQKVLQTTLSVNTAFLSKRFLPTSDGLWHEINFIHARKPS
jgi:hypothetical protein